MFVSFMSNVQPLEVVGRGSETQLQVGENINYLINSSFTDFLLTKLPPEADLFFQGVPLSPWVQ